MGRRAKPKKGKPARKSAKNDGSQVRDLEKRLAEALLREAAAAKGEAEALEQQAGTSKILELISSSPTDIQPVLEALAESAARLCGSVDASIYRRDGDRLFLVAQVGPIPQGVIGEFFLPLGRGTVVGRSVLDGRTVHVLDLQAMGDEFPEGREHARRLGLATVLAVPLMRAGVGIGSISLRRTEAQLFTPRQAALLETFANQAVIAIENVRLFNETKEALEQQTATSEILRVIARSPTDVQPVFAAVLASAARLCDALDATMFRVDGDVLRLVAHEGPIPSDPIGTPRPLAPGTPSARAVLEGRTIQVADLQAAVGEYPEGSAFARALNFRTVLSVPMLHADGAIGAITIRRAEVRPFTERQVELLRTFADQAVIAIENVRLFSELDARNRDLTTALDRQTATSEILRVISGSPTDAQPVFDTILRSAVQLCHSSFGIVARADGDLVRLVAIKHPRPEEVAAVYPAPLGSPFYPCRAIRENTVIHSPDVEEDGAASPDGLRIARAAGMRSFLVVPMRRDDSPIGSILISRPEVGPFPDEQIALLQTVLQAPDRATTIRRGQGVTTRAMEQRQPVQIADITIDVTYESPVRRPLIDAGHRALLGVPLLSEEEVIGVLAVTRKTPGEFAPEIVRLLTTFATQSAVAIQNARLFREIEIKSRQLEVASQHKSEFLASMSHELRTPLNAIIGVTDLLLEDARDLNRADEIEPLERVLRAGRHLLSLINDILDLSKIEAGRMELELDDFHLPSAIADALLLMRERAGRRGLALERHVDERLGEIRADQRKVKQVLLNLLSNAVKFTPEGGRIDVRASLVDGIVEISVADTGIGIAPEDQETVFEEFQQVGTADKKVEGTGLGLALCRKFVELHGGHIGVKSEVGRGSTFTFTLPVSREPSGRGGAPTLNS